MQTCSAPAAQADPASQAWGVAWGGAVMTHGPPGAVGAPPSGTLHSGDWDLQEASKTWPGCSVP